MFKKIFFETSFWKFILKNFENFFSEIQKINFLNREKFEKKEKKNFFLNFRENYFLSFQFSDCEKKK